MTAPNHARFEALDAWRGICALVVALVHLPTESVLHRNAVVMHGYRFVDFFFVLSGFVIAHAYQERLRRGGRAVRGFLIRRIGRLWPLHALVLFAFVAIQIAVWLAGHLGIADGHAAFAKNSLASVPANLVLVHAWGMYDNLTWNAPSWSISTEVFAYCVFAAMCASLPARWVTRAAAGLLIGSGLVVLLVAPAGMKSMFDYALFRCIYGFMTGVVVRALWGRVPLRWGTAGEVGAVCAVIAGVGWIPVGDAALVVTPLFGLAVAIFAAEDGALSRAMRRPLPQTLGAWSYSIYMVHPLVTAVVVTLAARAHVATTGSASLDGAAWLTGAISVCYLAVVVAVASWTYRHVELRGQRVFQRWATRAERAP